MKTLSKNRWILRKPNSNRNKDISERLSIDIIWPKKNQ